MTDMNSNVAVDSNKLSHVPDCPRAK